MPGTRRIVEQAKIFLFCSIGTRTGTGTNFLFSRRSNEWVTKTERIIIFFFPEASSYLKGKFDRALAGGSP